MKKTKKKLRKSKRNWFKKKPIFSVKIFFETAKNCKNISWENRQILFQELDRYYQEWLEEKRDQQQSVNVTKQIMIKLEEMLEEQNKLRKDAEKNKMIDKIWAEKKQDEADEIFKQVQFILDIIWFRQWVDSSEFLIPINN